MRQIVIIPCFRRPEFLGVCLKHILNARGAEENLYYFSVDRGYDPEVIQIIKSFPLESRMAIRRHNYTGNSFNLVRAYIEAEAIAKKQKFERVNLIETDIFIAPDYFEFHAAAAQLVPDAFFVSAVRNQNLGLAASTAHARDGRPEEVYLSNRFQSLGNSYPLSSVAKFRIMDTPAYFRGMQNFCRSKWPHSRLGTACVEQDGVINRIMEAEGLKGVYPRVPRAYHAGFHGYNRPGDAIDPKKQMPLEARISALMNMTAEEMNRRARRAEWKDITPCEMTQERTSKKLKVIEL